MAKTPKQTERICYVCRQPRPVDKLVRVARIDGKYVISPKGGRGCHIDPGCIEKAIKNRALHKSFKTNVGEEIYIALAKCVGKV